MCLVIFLLMCYHYTTPRWTGREESNLITEFRLDNRDTSAP